MAVVWKAFGPCKEHPGGPEGALVTDEGRGVTAGDVGVGVLEFDRHQLRASRVPNVRGRDVPVVECPDDEGDDEDPEP